MQTRARANQKRSVKLTFLAVPFLFLLSAVFVQAQLQDRPKPSPEQKKLEVWTGSWDYSGETKASPLGPAGTFSGKRTGRMILNGFFLENTWEEKGSMGDTKGVEIVEYDAAGKNHVFHAFGDDSSSVSGLSTVEGNTWTSKFSFTAPAGEKWEMKIVRKFSADGTSCESTGDISNDGKTWTPVYTGKMTKVKSAKRP